MSQDFVKGRTNQHLTWVMVDATDFASPESALSAATKIKIYGKVRGATGVNFVSSGTGSLTNDIQHVGASALGIYTIALAKADLSDASNAWYDQYVISLSATGAAYQTLIVDGGIDASVLLALSDAVSNVMSAVLLTQSMASDAASAAVVGASRALINQSRISDVQSFLSDFQSDLLSLLNTTGVQLNASMLSDLRSAIAAGPAATVTASDISDIASAVRAALVSDLSDILSAATAGASRALINQSRISDVQSFLSDFQSDLLSLLNTTGVGLNASTMSDLRSAIGAGPAATITASDISDIASAVRAILVSDLSDILSAATAGASRALINQSRISDVQSFLSDFQSDLISHLDTTGVGLNASTLSDLRSAITAGPTDVQLNASSLSDLRSAINAITATVSASDISDIASAVRATLVSDLSDILSAATAAASRALINQSRISDVQSFLSDMQSDLLSHIDTTGVHINASDLSDLRSAILAGPTDVQLNASSLSDIRSAINAITATVSASDISDIASAVRATLVSDLSDILSAAQQTNSRALVIQSRASDIYSLLSDLHSDLGVVSGVVSDVYSNLAAGVAIGASDMSDIRSAITANGMLAAGADPTGVVGVTATRGAKLDWLAAMSRNKLTQTSTVAKLFNDAGSAIASAAVSDDATTYTRDEWA